MSSPARRCCARRPNDGIVDEVEVDRAVAGRPAKLNPRELDRVVYRLHTERKWGLQLIAKHVGYGRTQINTSMKRQGLTDPKAVR